MPSWAPCGDAQQICSWRSRRGLGLQRITILTVPMTTVLKPLQPESLREQVRSGLEWGWNIWKGQEDKGQLVWARE